MLNKILSTETSPNKIVPFDPDDERWSGAEIPFYPRKPDGRDFTLDELNVFRQLLKEGAKVDYNGYFDTLKKNNSFTKPSRY
jgi:hypothetical protein